MIAQGRLCNVFLRRTAQPCKKFCHECPRAYFLHKKHETFLNFSSQCTARPALQNILSRVSAKAYLLHKKHKTFFKLFLSIYGPSSPAKYFFTSVRLRILYTRNSRLFLSSPLNALHAQPCKIFFHELPLAYLLNKEHGGFLKRFFVTQERKAVLKRLFSMQCPAMPATRFDLHFHALLFVKTLRAEN